MLYRKVLRILQNLKMFIGYSDINFLFYRVVQNTILMHVVYQIQRLNFPRLSFCYKKTKIIRTIPRKSKMYRAIGGQLGHNNSHTHTSNGKQTANVILQTP